MTDSNIPFNAQDILDFDLQQVITDAEARTCHAYEAQFVVKAKEYGESGDKKSQAICDLFGAFCSFSLSHDNPNEPYIPAWVFMDRRSFIPADIQAPYLEVLLEVVEKIEDAELRARIADVLWVLRKGIFHQIAGLAIDSYLESARRLEHPERWPDGANRIERALNIATQLGRNGEYFGKTIDFIEELLDRLKGEDPLWLSHSLMKLLLNWQVGDAGKYAVLSNKIALSAEAARFSRRSRDYFELNARWLERVNDKDEKAIYGARFRAADTYVKQAEDFVQNENPNYSAASAELMFAVEALRRISAPKEYIQQIHMRLLGYQEKDTNYQTISQKIDIADYAGSMRDAVKGKSLRDAILTLAALCSIPRIGMLREIAVGENQQFPFRLHIMARQINEKGRVVANRPSVTDDAEEAIKAEMYRFGAYFQQMNAQGMLAAVNQINMEHYIQANDLTEFVANNQFVPPGHEYIYMRGLYYGFTGDFMLATHFLMPQIENSIRYYLNRQGIVTTYLDPQGVQDEYPLGTLLAMPEIESKFDADLLFALKGLLINRFGSNLRNRFSHGLMSADKFSSGDVVYFWWLVLYLCCFPILVQQHQKAPNGSTPDANSTS